MKDLFNSFGGGRISVLGLGTPILLMTMLAMLVLPLPAVLLWVIP